MSARTASAPHTVSSGGLGYMIQAAFWFAIMALMVKLAGERGVPTMEIVLMRALVTLSLSAFGLWRARLSPFGNRTGLLLLRGLFGSGGLMCFYFAVRHLTLAEATVIHQISPVLTAVVAALWIGEQLRTRVLVGMTLAFAGVVLIAQPAALFPAADPVGPLGAETAATWPFVLVGVCGAIFAALAYVSVRQLGSTEPTLRIVLYFPVVTVPICAPFAIMHWVWPDALGWLYLLAVGASTQIAQIALTKGLALEPAGRAMAVGYLQIVFAALLGAIIFGTIPGLWSWAGMVLIAWSLFVATRR